MVQLNTALSFGWGQVSSVRWCISVVLLQFALLMSLSSYSNECDVTFTIKCCLSAQNCLRITAVVFTVSVKVGWRMADRVFDIKRYCILSHYCVLIFSQDVFCLLVYYCSAVRMYDKIFLKLVRVWHSDSSCHNCAGSCNNLKSNRSLCMNSASCLVCNT